MVSSALFFVILAAIEPPIERGRVVDGIHCAGDPSQTYAVYLPKAYDASKSWPLLYVFDPRKRGAASAELFADSAERHGWIVVSSNDTRSDDGDDAANARAVRAMWSDARSRFSVDPKRIYAAGFSGGAMLAWSLAQSTKAVAGVIVCSGRLDDPREAESIGFDWFGTVGDTDFNYLEMHDLDAHARTPHKLEVFSGSHGWPPASLIEQALTWLESTPKDSAPRPCLDDECDARRFEREERARIAPALNTFVRATQSSAQLAAALGVNRLKKIAAGSEPRARAAQRVLELMYVQLAIYLPQELLARKLGELAVRSGEVARIIHPKP